jgi:hypothetical protein
MNPKYNSKIQWLQSHKQMARNFIYQPTVNYEAHLQLMVIITDNKGAGSLPKRKHIHGS